MKQLLILWVFLCLAVPSARAEEIPSAARVINRTDNLVQEYQFPDDSPVLEIVFPRVYSADCAILRFGYDVMMVDAATGTSQMHDRILSALQSMGVDYIDVAFNTHPHTDHIGGFNRLQEEIPIGRLVLTFDEDENEDMIRTVRHFSDRDIPIEHVSDGDVLTLGPGEEVTLRVLQRNDSGSWSANNRSAMLLVTYGERSLLLAADVENHAQRSFGEHPPAEGIRADILKYPHHGQVKLHDPFLDAIDPELVIMTGANKVMNSGKSYLDRRKIPYLLSYQGLTRLRTDGKIWVVDYLHEAYTDRDTRNPFYQ